MANIHDKLRRQISPVPPPIDDVADPVPPPSDDVTDLMPPPGGETTVECDPQKFLNHGRKIVALPKTNEEWFQSELSLSGLKDLCMIGYTTVNHNMLKAFMDRWNSWTSSFDLLHGEMSITLDGVLCLLHLLIKGRFLHHERMTKDEALKMMVEYLGSNPREAMNELDKIRGAQARFVYLKKVYKDALLSAQQTDDDDEQVALHISHASRA
ncbi:uncharacterized protein LOC127103016 [Lathyrus oleraceus]|uniref:uncharacterized protein LOC127103016 n=1 Tax=Pisum sativum TaxID=3888 RepID=UPI0021D0EF48|nr:uncharacterized protein LOC127103016 [Pisum sativum]